MSIEQVTATWTFYMLSLLRRRLDLAWAEMDKIQARYQLPAFFFKHYELLHYYDNDYIIHDTLRYIEEQGGDVRELQRTE